MSEVAVVVATRDRAPRLRALLEALAAQEHAGFELIVVDDASRDDTAGVLADTPLELRVMRNPMPLGPGAARNRGWREAGAKLVAFTDDDCVPAPGWLAALMAAHEEEPGSILQGRTEPDPRERHELSAFSRSQLVEQLGPHFQACNIAYPRELLERLGGFDESFAHFGEDADLAWRAMEAGAPALFVPDALVHHAVHRPGALALIRGSQRWADAVRAFARHPGLRRDFHHGVFWKPSHATLVPALAGLFFARRTAGLSLVLAWPWLRSHRASHGSAAGLAAALPAHLALDAAETLAMARGSARFRTFVL